MTESQELTFRQRWGFKTNAADWLITIPNFGVEFDLGNDTRSKRTVNANLKWNWNTSHKYLPSTVFNLFDARIEWRQYFRTRQQNVPVTLKHDGFFKYLKGHVFSTKRNHPRDSRAYYWGVYANAASYNFKLGKRGRQGNAYGAGISLGYTMPLYGYGSEGNGRRFIDLELGGAIGLVFTNYDVYEHDAESNCYPIIKDKCRSGHLVPFPLVTDLRVAFVYRFMSVRDKYKQTIERRYDIKQAALNKQREQEARVRQSLDSLQSVLKRRGEVVTDSMLTKEQKRIWRTMQSEQRAAAQQEADAKLRQQIADSLGIVLTDSLSTNEERALRRAVNDYREQQEKLEKRAKRSTVSKSANEADKDMVPGVNRRQEKREKKAKKEKKKQKAEDSQVVEPVKESEASSDGHTNKEEE